MTAGRIESHTPDRFGGTLATAAAVGATVLQMVDQDGDDSGTADFADFDIEGLPPQFCAIADSGPLEYVAVDDDASTVTLAESLTIAYEAGAPVTIWDPNVSGVGAPVVDYVADVETEQGTAWAVLPHGLAPAAGFDSLEGASVTIDDEDEDDDPSVRGVHGRRPVWSQAFIDSPVFSVRLAANQSIPSDTDVELTNWEGQDGTDDNSGDTGGAPSGGGGWYKATKVQFRWNS